jgi:hypothetical protein
MITGIQDALTEGDRPNLLTLGAGRKRDRRSGRCIVDIILMEWDNLHHDKDSDSGA